MNGPEPAEAVDALRELEADGAIVVQGNTDVAVADFDYAAAFPWLPDGVPRRSSRRRRVGPRRARRRAARLAPPPAGGAARPHRRHARARLPRLARLADAGLRPGPRPVGRPRARCRGPTPGSSAAATPTCPRSATSAGRSSSTTAAPATSSTATRPPRGRSSSSTARRSSAEIRRTEYDILAVANAISARGLPGRRLPRRDGPNREARPMTTGRRRAARRRDRDGHGQRARQRRRLDLGRACSPGGPAIRTIEAFDPVADRLADRRRGPRLRRRAASSTGRTPRRIDRYIQFGLVVARQALDQAGLPGRIEGELAERTGVILGLRPRRRRTRSSTTSS